MAEFSVVSFVIEKFPELWLRTGEHILLAGGSTLMAVAIGLPLGILASRYVWLKGPLLSFVGILQTIPSLALLVMLLALFGKIGVLPAFVALTLYALLPIARNTVTGIEGVQPSLVEAAQGVGMTSWQRLRYVELPLASDVIMAGVRTAAVIGVGIATLSAFIGAGGLGQFINRGLTLVDTKLVLLGAIPAALLAILVDSALQAFNWSLRERRIHSAAQTSGRRIAQTAALVAPIFILGFGVFATFSNQLMFQTAGAEQKTIVIGSKSFSEQFILSEIMAQLIEAKTDITVQRQFNLGGTAVAHGALVAGELDMYPEYTGTALLAVVKQPQTSDADKAYNTVKELYFERYNLVWLQPFGFNNTFAMTVRKTDAQKYGWERLSDLAKSSVPIRGGFGPEFSEREDGLPGLQKAYGLQFSEIRELNLNLLYDALAREEVDVINANSTDGRIVAFDFKVLADDRSYFPPYFAAPVVRKETLTRYPELQEVLSTLAGRIDSTTMSTMNYEVDGKKRNPKDVAKEFLIQSGLLEPNS